MTPPRVLTAEEVAEIESRALRKWEDLPGLSSTVDTLDLIATIRDRDAKIAKLRAAIELVYYENNELNPWEVVKRVVVETTGEPLV